MNWWIDLFKLAFVRHLTMVKASVDAAAMDGSQLPAIAVGDAVGTKKFTRARVLVSNVGFSTDGTDYFTVGFFSVNPVTGATEATAEASFAGKTVLPGQWAEATLNAPLQVKKGNFVLGVITKFGAGLVLSTGIVQLR